MIIYLWYRISLLVKLVTPRRTFVATYRPSSEAERAQSERERNVTRKYGWKIRELTSRRK